MSKTGLMYSDVFANYKAVDGYLCLSAGFNPCMATNDYYDTPERMAEAYDLFKCVDDALAQHNPDIIVPNAIGTALLGEQFKDGLDIIMGKEDVKRMTKKMSNSKIIAVHMDAINHMTVDCMDFSEYLRENGVREKVMIPFDGEKMTFK